MSSRGQKPFQITGTVATVSDAATITLDMSAFDNFAVTLTGNRLLAAPLYSPQGAAGSSCLLRTPPATARSPMTPSGPSLAVLRRR